MQRPPRSWRKLSEDDLQAKELPNLQPRLSERESDLHQTCEHIIVSDRYGGIQSPGNLYRYPLPPHPHFWLVQGATLPPLGCVACELRTPSPARWSATGHKAGQVLAGHSTGGNFRTHLIPLPTRVGRVVKPECYCRCPDPLIRDEAITTFPGHRRRLSTGLATWRPTNSARQTLLPEPMLCSLHILHEVLSVLGSALPSCSLDNT